MKKQIFFGLILSLVIVAALGIVKYFQIQRAIAEGSKKGPPPPAVTLYQVRAENWEETFRAVGTVFAKNGTILRSEESGTVIQIAKDSGAQVKKGELLIELDTSVEQGQLNALSANLVQAEKALSRASSLRKENIISQEELEAAKAKSDYQRGELSSIRARIDRKKIVAPFDGVLGVRRVEVGDYVTIGQELFPLVSSDTLYIDFSVPQKLRKEIKVGQTVKILLDDLGYSGESLEAKIGAIDPLVDPNLRMFTVRAEVLDSKGVINPGEFAPVEIISGKIENLLTIPASSIKYVPYGDSVFIANTKEGVSADLRVVEEKIVELGPRRGDQVAVIKGLKGGESIVSSGVFRMRPELSVKVVESPSPSSLASPEVEEG